MSDAKNLSIECSQDCPFFFWTSGVFSSSHELCLQNDASQQPSSNSLQWRLWVVFAPMWRLSRYHGPFSKLSENWQHRPRSSLKSVTFRRQTSRKSTLFLSIPWCLSSAKGSSKCVLACTLFYTQLFFGGDVDFLIYIFLFWNSCVSLFKIVHVDKFTD